MTSLGNGAAADRRCSGSSAPQLGLAVLQALHEAPGMETHQGTRLSIAAEMGPGATREFTRLADWTYRPEDLGATISSGSFRTAEMVVVPCSMRTLAAIATGNTADLLTRAADVCLKERRRLVLVTRETPLNLIHIRNMETVTLAGGMIMPPVPAFYHEPKTIEDMLRHTAGKVLDQCEIEHDLFRRWEGFRSAAAKPEEDQPGP